MVEKLVANPCGKHSKQRQDACSLIWHGWQVEKVKEHALRGWVDGGDGRLYHHVVAEKALEAWIEKLASAISGAQGNAKRWSIEIDTSELEGQLRDAVYRLKTSHLNPKR